MLKTHTRTMTEQQMDSFMEEALTGSFTSKIFVMQQLAQGQINVYDKHLAASSVTVTSDGNTLDVQSAGNRIYVPEFVIATTGGSVEDVANNLLTKNDWVACKLLIESCMPWSDLHKRHKFNNYLCLTPDNIMSDIATMKDQLFISRTETTRLVVNDAALQAIIKAMDLGPTRDYTQLDSILGLTLIRLPKASEYNKYVSPLVIALADNVGAQTLRLISMDQSPMMGVGSLSMYRGVVQAGLCLFDTQRILGACSENFIFEKFL